MQKATKKVTNVDKGSYVDKYGNEKWYITFEDGTKGEFTCKPDNQDLFTIGAESTFMWEQRHGTKKDGTPFKWIKLSREPREDNQHSYANGGKNGGNNESTERGVSLRMATDIMVARIAAGDTSILDTTGEILRQADIFYRWIHDRTVSASQIAPNKPEASSEAPAEHQAQIPQNSPLPF